MYDAQQRVASTDLGIVDKSTAFAVGRQLTRRCVLETFNDGSLARAIVPDNQSQWRV